MSRRWAGRRRCLSPPRAGVGDLAQSRAQLRREVIERGRIPAASHTSSAPSRSRTFLSNTSESPARCFVAAFGSSSMSAAEEIQAVLRHLLHGLGALALRGYHALEQRLIGAVDAERRSCARRAGTSVMGARIMCC